MERIELAKSAPAAKPSLPDLQIGVKTDPGPVRELNEDSVAYFVPEDPVKRRRKGAIFLVADGMGGHQAGEVASKMAAERVVREYYADTEHRPGDSLVRAVKIANQAVYELAQADPSKAGMGTTMVAAVIRGRRVYIANVGDSRAYLINSQGIRQITEDHSWVEEQVQAGLLTRKQAEHHPRRNLITRALGHGPSVEVDLFKGVLSREDALLLCSDGLHGPVTDSQMAAAVRAGSPAEAARRLIKRAIAQGADDNISVIIVREKPPVPPELAAEDARPTAIAPARHPLLILWEARWRQLLARLPLSEEQSRWLLPGLAALLLVFLCLCLGLGSCFLHNQSQEQQEQPGITPPPTLTPAPEGTGSLGRSKFCAQSGPQSASDPLDDRPVGRGSNLSDHRSGIPGLSVVKWVAQSKATTHPPAGWVLNSPGDAQDPGAEHAQVSAHGACGRVV
ncbi:MAG TPA: Stp1/IreP family PP2C-type Ser/Thr phosphatase [Anaerolineae bacterium]|nr:Stp1/IreP family PP2C-type Ser/Thr phosphatase [Anaerolineae bacterium]